MLYIALSFFATFLIGVNAALVYRFWPESWFIMKAIAVSLLLTYVSFSLLYGDSAAWRAAIAVVAILTDFVAIGGVWRAMHKAEKGDGVLIAYRRR